MAGSLDLYLADRKSLKPSSMYGWTGSLWVPMLIGATGAIAGTVDANGSEQVVIYDSNGNPLDYNGSTPVAGDVAHDAVDSGNPTKIGGRAVAGLSSITVVSAADRTDTLHSTDGAVYVRQVPFEDIVSGSASVADGTQTSVIAAYASGKQYLTKVSFSNTHATASVLVDIVSGSTVMWANVNVPPGGRELNFSPPLPPNASNEAWKFDPAGSGVATLYCSMLGFKSKV